MTEGKSDKVITEIYDRHRAWFTYFQWWRHGFWACGVVAATASALAAADTISGSAAPYFALLSSVCIAILGFTNPQRRANAYITAWRTLGSALLRFEAGKCEIGDLIAAVDKGEAAIAEADVKGAGDLPH